MTLTKLSAQGATVVDFAYHVHTDVGNQMVGVKVRPHCVTMKPQLFCLVQGLQCEMCSAELTRVVATWQVNGKLVDLSHALANAEVVEVLTYPGPPTSLTVQRHQVNHKGLSLKGQ